MKRLLTLVVTMVLLVGPVLLGECGQCGDRSSCSDRPIFVIHDTRDDSTLKRAIEPKRKPGEGRLKRMRETARRQSQLLQL